MADRKDVQDDSAEAAVEQWKVKRLIQNLEAARGNGTSMISLIIPPKDQLSRVNQMLTVEYGTASNIKSRVNRLSVLSAITSVQQRLKLYNRIPDNGLVIYCGTVITPEGKEKKISIDFEPFKPINTSLYLCDNKFHTEALQELLENDEKFGFIVMDGQGTLFGTVCGSTRTVLYKFNVDLPKKHHKGGQSSVRFARLRIERRQNYIRKVAELATQIFISGDRPNVSGLILAGPADFKVKLHQSDVFDPRLSAIVIKIVDVSYGGENGFSQAIELSADALANVKFMREKKLLANYYNEIARDTGKYVFGVNETIKALESGAVEELIVWEDLPVNRYVLRNKETGAEKVVFLNEQQEKNTNFFKDSRTGAELEVVDKESLLDWLSLHFKEYGAKLSFVTNKSQEGAQFCKGFGGIGAILRYQLDLSSLDEHEHNEAAANQEDGAHEEGEGDRFIERDPYGDDDDDDFI